MHPTPYEEDRLAERADEDMSMLPEYITDVLNFMSNDTERGYLVFCRAMERQHRTLQQAFTRLCVAWFVYAADPAYRTDARNEGTHELAMSLLPLLKEAHLPFI
jgi:hypothetical protein